MIECLILFSCSYYTIQGVSEMNKVTSRCILSMIIVYSDNYLFGQFISSMKWILSYIVIHCSFGFDVCADLIINAL